ncbi:hypothetical protein [Paenibacillus phytorum]|uniref:hypothetical protein n=1 Tax=Paenibacillus phytorum TaxID=2654977 RepID=UPI001491EE16|nr:hypothetical protein [Paenibacillus phytorum]
MSSVEYGWPGVAGNITIWSLSWLSLSTKKQFTLDLGMSPAVDAYRIEGAELE